MPRHYLRTHNKLQVKMEDVTRDYSVERFVPDGPSNGLPSLDLVPSRNWTLYAILSVLENCVLPVVIYYCLRFATEVHLWISMQSSVLPFHESLHRPALADIHKSVSSSLAFGDLPTTLTTWYDGGDWLVIGTASDHSWTFKYHTRTSQAT